MSPFSSPRVYGHRKLVLTTMRILLCLGIFGAFGIVPAFSSNYFDFVNDGDLSLLAQIKLFNGNISYMQISDSMTPYNPNDDRFPHRSEDIGVPQYYMFWLHDDIAYNTNTEKYSPSFQFLDIDPGQYNSVNTLYVKNTGFSTKFVAELYDQTYPNCSIHQPNNHTIPINWTHNSIPTELGQFTSLEEIHILAQTNGKRTHLSQTRDEFKARGSFLYDDYSPQTRCDGRFNLTGTIPTEIGLLTNLKILELQGLGLTGTIPTQLAQLTKLEMLLLGGNSLLPGGIASNTLQGGLTGGVTPDLFKDMPNLSVVYLNLNGFDYVNVNTIELPQVKYVNAQQMVDNSIARVCGNAIDYVNTPTTTSQRENVSALETAIQGGLSKEEIQAAVDAVYTAFGNQSVFLTNTNCSDATTTSTTTNYTTTTNTTLSTTTTTTTTTTTETHIGCSNYTTRGDTNSSVPMAITDTPQFEFCLSTESLNCPCHLIFSDDAQIIYGRFSDLATLCPRLETLSVHNNVFLDGLLSDISACTGIKRLIFGRSTLLHFPLSASDFIPFPELKILKAHNLYESIELFENGFVNLAYADVTYGYLTGVPLRSFWTGVFSRNITDRLDIDSLNAHGSSMDVTTFSAYNFLNVDATDFGPQFPSANAPTYPFKRRAAMSGSTNAATVGHNTHSPSSDCGNTEKETEWEIGIFVVLVLMLVTLVTFVGCKMTKGIGYTRL